MSSSKDKWLENRLAFLSKRAENTKKQMCYAFFITKENDKEKKHDLGFFSERNEGVAFSRAFQLIPSNPATGAFPSGKVQFISVNELVIK